jgi:hypothetical protein
LCRRKIENSQKKLSLLLINERICFAAGLLTRNNSLDFELSQAKYSQKKLFNTLIRNFGYCGNQSPLTAMQMSSGNPSMSSNTQVITLDTFRKFLETRQMESKSDCEIKIIIEVREIARNVLGAINQIQFCFHSAMSPINTFDRKIYLASKDLRGT